MAHFFLKYCLSCVLIGLFSNCKAYQKVDWVKPKLSKEVRSVNFEKRQLDRLKVGDSLQINVLSEDDKFLIFHSYTKDSIKGVLWKQGLKKLKDPVDSGVKIQQVNAIKVRKYNATSTILLIGIAIPVTIFLVAGIHVLTNGIDLF